MKSPATSEPNILLFIVDDLGVHQLGCTGAATSGFFATPNMDRFASEGLQFTRTYATAPVCSPARASLYTGVHPARLHLTDFIPGCEAINTPMLPPPWRRGLPVEAVTLGDALKARGYATAHLGKWHLASNYDYTPGRAMDPESQGFEEVFVTRKPKNGADPESDPHHIDELTERAIEFCTRARPRTQPFFCVLAHNAVHRPEIAPAALVSKYAGHALADREMNRPALAAMLEQLDTAFGRLLDALRRAGRDRDTLVVVTSDHGAYGASERRKPLRGAKADLYEGGLRVPLLLRWPGKIAADATRTQIVSGADIFPTVLSAANAPVTEKIDGVDLWPSMQNPRYSLARESLHWHYPHYHHLGIGPSGAVRTGGFKLIEWFAPTPAYELFDLDADPGETRNLAADQPARRDAMLQSLHEWRRTVGAQEMKPNPAYNAAAPTRLLPPAGDLSPT